MKAHLFTPPNSVPTSRASTLVRCTIPLLMAAVIAATASPALAAFLTPVAVSVSSQWHSSGDASASAMINGSGLSTPHSATSTHLANNDLWHSSGGQVNLEWAIFDLGILHNLTHTYVWNANQPGSTLGRGVQDFTIQYSSDSLVWSDPVGYSLAMAGGTDLQGAETLNTVANSVRWVRFNILSNHDGAADSNAIVGLSEVRFEGEAWPAPPDTAVRVNIDFNGMRHHPTDELGSTFSGQGAGGGGDFFNGVTVNSQLPDGSNNDNLTVVASGLLASDGTTSTPVTFTIGGGVGGDNNGAPTAPDNPEHSSALYGDYIYYAANLGDTPVFTIGGLTPGSLVDLYFYTNGAIDVDGATAALFTPTGFFNDTNTLFYSGVEVSEDGTITGVLNHMGSAGILYGLSVVYDAPLAIPEPSALALTALGGFAVLVAARRRRVAFK